MELVIVAFALGIATGFVLGLYHSVNAEVRELRELRDSLQRILEGHREGPEN